MSYPHIHVFGNAGTPALATCGDPERPAQRRAGVDGDKFQYSWIQPRAPFSPGDFIERLFGLVKDDVFLQPSAEDRLKRKRDAQGHGPDVLQAADKVPRTAVSDNNTAASMTEARTPATRVLHLKCPHVANSSLIMHYCTNDLTWKLHCSFCMHFRGAGQTPNTRGCCRAPCAAGQHHSTPATNARKAKNWRCSRATKVRLICGGSSVSCMTAAPIARLFAECCSCSKHWLQPMTWCHFAGAKNSTL